jgi:hypothetical protein
MSFIKNLSVYIPRIHEEDANEDFIKHIFFSQEIASVRRIDFMKCTAKGKVYYNAKIHFHFWFKNQIAYNIQQRVLSSGTSGARIVYEDPWYWIVLKNKNHMSENELCINERLEYIEKYMTEISKKNKKAKKHIKQLSTQISEQTEQLKMLDQELYQQNYTYRTCVKKNLQEILQEILEEVYEEQCHDTSQACADYVLQETPEKVYDEVCRDTSRGCVEYVLKEEPESDTYLDYSYPNMNEQKCEGCVLLELGLGGENQLGHSCLENYMM